MKPRYGTGVQRSSTVVRKPRTRSLRDEPRVLVSQRATRGSVLMVPMRTTRALPAAPEVAVEAVRGGVAPVDAQAVVSASANAATFEAAATMPLMCVCPNRDNSSPRCLNHCRRMDVGMDVRGDTAWLEETGESFLDAGQ